MSLQIIKANPIINRDFFNKEVPHLKISEFFCDTIQGEGIYTGVPATFLRMKGCTLDCVYCDSKAVWRNGNPYYFDELFGLMEAPMFDLIKKFKQGQHLVITGGSPLLQQKQLSLFIREFIDRYKFKPFIEVENECVLDPIHELIEYVDCWNNSPKLLSSGKAPYKPPLIAKMSELRNSWFKFVVEKEKDWTEIVNMYLTPGLIRHDQVILMPMGADLREVQENRELVVDISIQNNVRYSTREHVVLWNKTTGV